MVRARGRRAGSSDQDIERGHGCGVVGSSEREVGTKAGDWRNVLSYQDFLERKSQLGSMDGFEPVWLPDFLFDFQRALVEWNIAKGRSATFADCGLGKTPMQLVWAENVVRKTNKRCLIITPLAVGAQTKGEGDRFGVECSRSRDGKLDTSKIVITNYEKLHLFDSNDFVGIACDESSILKNFAGETKKAVTRFMLKLPYRSLWTATAAPNDYVELGTSSEALGELGYTDMLNRFFTASENAAHHRMEKMKREGCYFGKDYLDQKQGNHFAKLSFRVSQTINQWVLKGHAHEHFWRWICSWARACRKPSDLGFPDGDFILPPLTEREHIIEPSKSADGMLFTLPAFGLNAEREERRRTLKERCEYVAKLVDHKDPAVVWCHLNPEGDMLEDIIPNSIQVKGGDSDEYKEAVVDWFCGNKCICNAPMFRSKLAAWQRDLVDIGKNCIGNIANSALEKLASGNKEIDRTGKNTCADTTKKIQNDSDLRQGCLLENAKEGTADTGMTRNLGEQFLPQPKPIESSTQLVEPTRCLENTKRRSRHTKKRLPAKAGSVPSVGQPMEQTSEDTGSTLTTATKQESTGECSAQIAILDSESSEIIQNYLSGQRCICGHKNGNRKLISKAKIFGWGLNLQCCAHVVTFASHSFEQYYQSVRRCWRFGQKRPVTVDIVATTGEKYVRENMVRKAEAATQMFEQLVKHMNQSLNMKRTRNDQPSIQKPSWL